LGGVWYLYRSEVLRGTLMSAGQRNFGSAVLRGTEGMFHLGNRERIWLVAAAAAAAAVALVVVWLLPTASPDLARDYEDCVERAQAQGLAGDEAGNLIAGCGARFAGRRKADGGYSYYDFMQDKKFDIAGPNPTPDERKSIDREYIGYLETQRREAISAALATQQNEKLRVDIETARQPAGAPLALTPASVPLPVPRRVAEQRERARHCAEDALFCTLSKLSSAVKDAFASSSKTKSAPHE
jgi:hypothetical protein